MAFSSPRFYLESIGKLSLPKPAKSARKRSFVGVLEPDVFVQRRLLDGGIVASVAFKLHLVPGRVTPQHVSLQLVFRTAFEIAELALEIHV